MTCIKEPKKTIMTNPIECGGETNVTIEYTVGKCNCHRDESVTEPVTDCCGTCPTGAKIVETVTSDFQIISIGTPSTGTISPVTLPAQSFTWNIGNVGRSNSETKVSLTFRVKHVSQNSGELNLNASLVYSDNQRNTVTFPAPKLTVEECEEECNAVNANDTLDVATTVDSCVDTGLITVNPYIMQSLGRIVKVNVRVKNVCPNKRLSVAVLLNETDDQGNNPKPRGLKVFVVEPQGEAGDDCADVCLNCINFAASEALLNEIDEEADTTSMCNERYFTATVIAHHTDSDYTKCEE